jgi:non-ribosomal peptide synthetase-like protein
MNRLVDYGLRAAALVYLIFQFLVVGLALVPAIFFVRIFWTSASVPVLALSFGVGYLIFGITYLALVVVIRLLLGFRGREGDYPFVSGYAIRWAFLGSLVGLAKILILGHLKGMPLINAFYRAMGARIGRNVVINTCNVFDFDMITIGDDAFIGGDAVVIGHVGERGVLKIRPVRIGKACTVGQSSVVFPGAVMGDRSVLGAMSLLPKGRELPAGTVWGGNPLREIRRENAATAAAEEGAAAAVEATGAAAASGDTAPAGTADGATPDDTA